MELNSETCFQALLTGDMRFDGCFFVGVSSTGIYCRPICPAKAPRPENCTFYHNAAQAEKAGYRPCLRCRPELAPGYSRVEAVSRLASAAASRIEDGALTEIGVSELARELGVSDRHLRRVVEKELGVTPIELAQTQRLLLAKRLLTDTKMPVTDIAFASGFSSLRRFNALFKERYRLNPTRLRKERNGDLNGGSLSCDLVYRPPLDWDFLIGFLSARATRGVESVTDGCYSRTVAIGKHRGWISVSPSANKRALKADISTSLAPVLIAVIARIKRLFDLAADPVTIGRRLATLGASHPGVRVPGAFDGFEMAIRAILGQQVSVRGASTLASRFALEFGEAAETPFPMLTHFTPSAERVAAAKLDQLTALGITGARAKCILAIARATAAGKVKLDFTADVEKTMAQLLEIPGVGDWTAQYIAMRALSWPDAFPHTDLGIRKALGETEPGKILQLAENWRPWRAYATMHLWRSLEEKR
jgi:AraC family transcriptional regulator of adaptative response / DNA-3-methyladenine glycosylase II